MRNLILFVLVLLWFSGNAQISTYLEQIINESPDKKIPVVVILNNQWKADSAMKAMKIQKLTASERIRTTVKSVKAFTSKSQKAILADLDNMKNQFEFEYIKPFWAANIIALKTTPDAIYALASHKDLMEIVYDEPGFATYPDEKVEFNGARPDEAEQGLIAINAPFLWSLGYTGKGRIAMGIDTGIFPDHPAFENRFLGNYLPLSQCWFGFNNTWPFDISDHGTHTMGTTVGFMSRLNDTIGVAFDAYFIAADPIVSNLSELRPRSELMESFQWALNPDGDENTVTDVPDAINNSWGLSNTGNPDNCEMPATLVLNTVEAAGIAVIFSAGNDGPDGGTIGEPAHIARSTTNVFSVGAINGGTLGITGFSSNGPTNCYDGPDTSLHIKPEVVAPGDGVYSAVPPDNYGSMSGTSMAAPHVTGAVVLLKEAFPEVSGDEILMALYNTATDLGDAGEDNTYGNGLIDLEAAYNYLSASHTPTPPLTDYVDPYVVLPQKQFVGPKTSYSISMEIVTADSSDFSITNLSLIYNGSALTFDSSMIDSVYKKVVTIQLDPTHLEETVYTHKIYGSIETDGENDDTINNQFWFEIYHPEVKTIPYTETFENGEYDFLNTSVFSENPDKFITWKVDTIDGFANNAKAAKMMFVKYRQLEGARDIMHFPPVDIALADEPNFSFKYCYAKRAFSIYKDTLLVLARYGENYAEKDTLYLNYGEPMATMDQNYNTFNFVPTSSQQWRDTTISITHLQSYGNIKLEFVAINDNGNNLWIDNVAIHEGENPLSNSDIILEEVNVSIYPNPAQTHVFIKSEGQSGIVSLINLSGQTLSTYQHQVNEGILKISLVDLPKGIYLIKFAGSKSSLTQKLIKY